METERKSSRNGPLPRISDVGITEVYSHEQKDKVIADIILVHGLKGHPLRTWAHGNVRTDDVSIEDKGPEKKSRSLRKLFKARASRDTSPAASANITERSCYWPFDLLPLAFPAARILTYGYDSHPTHFYNGGTNRMTITQHARDLMNKVALARSQCTGRPIIFIAHSLGGILVKGALNEAQQMRKQPQCLDVQESCFGIVFMGTPHLGASIAPWGDMLTNVMGALPGGLSTYSGVLRGLSPDSETLDGITRRFNDILAEGRIKICSIQEGLGTSGVKGAGSKVVPDYSSTFNRPDIEQSFFSQRANHMNMCKFSGAEDQAWIELSQVLVSYSSAIQARTPDAEPQVGTVRSKLASTVLADALDFDNRKLRAQQLSQLELVEESFEWVWSSVFAQWLVTDDTLFWISGSPASGKSTLVNYVTNDQRLHDFLPQDKDYLVVNFYFDYRGGDGVENNLEGLRRSLLLDILPELPGLLSQVEQRFGIKTHSSYAAQRYVDVAEILTYVLETNTRPLLIFLDGLDEFNGQKADILRLIQQFGRNEAKVCLSSRADPPFSLAFRDLRFTFRMQELNRAGIEAYARNTLSLLYRDPDPAESKPVDEAAEFIANCSSGIFLWARFAVEEAFEQTTRGTMHSKSLLSVLSQMPRELEAVYERILDANKGEDRENCHIILELIESAARPLGVSELLQAAHCGGCSFVSRTDELNHDSTQRFYRYLQALGGGLIETLVVDLDEGDDSTESEVAEQDEETGSIESIITRRDKEGYVALVRMLHRTVQTYLDKGGWQTLFGNVRTAGSGHRRWIEVLCAFRSLAGRDSAGGVFKDSRMSSHKAHIIPFNDPHEGWRGHSGAIEKYMNGLSRKMRQAESETHQRPSRKLTLSFKSLYEYSYRYLPLHAAEFEDATGRSTWPLLRHVFDQEYINEHMGGESDCGCRREMTGYPFLLTSDVHFAIAHELNRYVESAMAHVSMPYQSANSVLDLPALPEPQSGNFASLSARVVLRCCRDPTALRCQLVHMLIPFSARLQDDEMLFAIQYAPVQVVESLLATFPGGRLRLEPSKKLNKWLNLLLFSYQHSPAHLIKVLLPGGRPRTKPAELFDSDGEDEQDESDGDEQGNYEKDKGDGEDEQHDSDDEDEQEDSDDEDEQDLKPVQGFGPLWAVGGRVMLHKAEQLLEATQLLDLFLARGEDINAVCGPSGTILHATVMACLDFQRLQPRAFLEACIRRGADVNVSGPEGNVLEYVWRRANTDPLGEPEEYGDFEGCDALPTLLIKTFLALGAVNHTRDPNGLIPTPERMNRWGTEGVASCLGEKYFYVHGFYPSGEVLSSSAEYENREEFERGLEEDLQTVLARAPTSANRSGAERRRASDTTDTTELGDGA